MVLTVTADSKYILDTGVFIQAKRSYYAFDLAPKFWESLIYHADNGQVYSIDKVKQELEKGKDDLTEWAISHFDYAFASTDESDAIQAYRDVIAWVNAQDQFLDYAKTEFADCADGWLIAYAKAKSNIVVTEERYEPARRNKIKIPNVCEALNVEYIDTFEMLRRLGVRFD